MMTYEQLNEKILKTVKRLELKDKKNGTRKKSLDTYLNMAVQKLFDGYQKERDEI